jgi:activator of HSP90 ATPase
MESEGLSEKEFFEKHGFVLLRHETKVKEWNTDYAKEDSEITTIYHDEVEELIKTKIYPEGKQIINQANAVLHRGRGTATNKYANGVHQDYGFTVEDFKQ